MNRSISLLSWLLLVCILLSLAGCSAGGNGGDAWNHLAGGVEVVIEAGGLTEGAGVGGSHAP